MVFSSYVFILLFLPLTLLIWHLLGKHSPIWQKRFLIAASLFFYAWASLPCFCLFTASLLVNFMLSRAMCGQKKLFFILGLVCNIALLAWFKYRNFFAENINLFFGTDIPLLRMVLPLGISFFSFQQISWLLAVYREELRPDSFTDYCLYMSFFPKLSMGPLAEPAELIPQFNDETQLRIKSENLAPALYLFAMGLFKKTVVADSLALFVNNGFAMVSPGFAASWASSLSYTMQLYFDFSGYSDMAMALGLMFNIRLPANFISPYKAESIGDFWRRWHATLGRSLAKFIYRPLGGSFHGLGRTCLNLLLTFLVSGLWHGAAWTFVVWGLLHGLINLLERVFSGALERVPRLIRQAGTFMAVNLLWVLFRAESWQQAMGIYRGMLDFSNPALYELQTLAFDGNINYPAIVDIALVLGALALCMAVVFGCKNSQQLLERFRPDKAALVSTVLMMLLSMLCMTRESVFIYFNF